MKPQVSVVMGVFNGADGVRESVLSALEQDGVSLEVIVVDDGSTDDTASLLLDLAKTEPRLSVLRQSNGGLTTALVRGCAAARGAYIARLDCGDRCLPGRLARELEIASESPGAALISCATRFIGPEGEVLYEVVQSAREAAEGLLQLDVNLVRGPSHHGSVLFPRSLYERVGGYRTQFYFAQDLDLWLRLVEHGHHVAIPEVLYEARLGIGSISTTQRPRQTACAAAVIECARQRREGSSESQSLAHAAAIRPDRAGRKCSAAALYFIGSCLRRRGDPRARKYFLEALRQKPYHFLAALRLLQVAAAPARPIGKRGP